MNPGDFMEALSTVIDAVEKGRVAEAEVSLSQSMDERTADVTVRNEIKPYSPMTVIQEREEVG